MDFDKMKKNELLAFLHRDDVQCYWYTVKCPKKELVFACNREYRILCSQK